jgi:endonuclease YncB( thermonuclease family)
MAQIIRLRMARRNRLTDSFVVPLLAFLIVAGAGTLMLRADWPGLASVARAALPEASPALAIAAQDFTACRRRTDLTCVVDGDTFRIAGEVIRIADIDTPEVHSPACPAEKALGERATLRLTALLNAGPFELMAYERDVDRYGRSLRVVTRDGVSVGGVLVAEGLAHAWDGRKHPWC